MRSKWFSTNVANDVYTDLDAVFYRATDVSTGSHVCRLNLTPSEADRLADELHGAASAARVFL